LVAVSVVDFFAALDVRCFAGLLRFFALACFAPLVDVGVTLVVTVVVAFAPGALVVTVLVLLALGAARAGVAIKAADATDAINFFIRSSCLRQHAPEAAS
jgi:hypothetical protein